MGRLIFLILLVVVAVWVVRRALRPHASRHDDGTGGSREPKSDATGGRLVRCAHCGTYLPEAEAKRIAGQPYCTEDHARLGPRKL